MKGSITKRLLRVHTEGGHQEGPGPWREKQKTAQDGRGEVTGGRAKATGHPPTLGGDSSLWWRDGEHAGARLGQDREGGRPYKGEELLQTQGKKQTGHVKEDTPDFLKKSSQPMSRRGASELMGGSLRVSSPGALGGSRVACEQLWEISGV